MGGAGEAEGCECGDGGFLEHGGRGCVGLWVIMTEAISTQG